MKESVLIAGGGVAAMEAALALQDLAGDRAEVTICSPRRNFIYRPYAVGVPYGVADVATYDLERLATAAGGEADIFPVNFYSDGDSILIRTAPGTKLLELTVHDSVAFETDGWTDDEAWSVIAHGRARQLERQSEIDEAEKAPLQPWIPTLKYRFVHIDIDRMTGRRFARTPEPDRW